MAKNKQNRGRAVKPADLPAGTASATSIMIVWHPDAVVDLDSQVTDRQTRGRIHSSVDVFRRSGCTAPYPAQSAVKGGDGLRELRVGGGQVPWRPIFQQVDGTSFFVIWALGPEAVADQTGFDAAVERAKKRRKADTATKANEK